MNSDENEEKMTSLLGIGLDAPNGDEEVRLTRGRNFALVGGSQETHEVMQETVCKVNENLELWIPEHTELFVDAACIPSDAKGSATGLPWVSLQKKENTIFIISPTTYPPFTICNPASTCPLIRTAIPL